jgi:hypothetical protein
MVGLPIISDNDEGKQDVVSSGEFVVRKAPSIPITLGNIEYEKSGFMNQPNVLNMYKHYNITLQWAVKTENGSGSDDEQYYLYKCFKDVDFTATTEQWHPGIFLNITDDDNTFEGIKIYPDMFHEDNKHKLDKNWMCIETILPSNKYCKYSLTISEIM